MLLFNLPKEINHMKISKGVNIDATKVTPPPPMFQIRPFNNYMTEAMNTVSDESLMGWNNQGTFTPTNMVNNSTRSSLYQLSLDASITEMINERKRF